MRKELVINPAFCKGCGICAAFCPKGALVLKGGKAARNEEAECILCGLCEERCPDYAIFIRTEEEAAQ